jgi:predicted nucleic acid-binding protein
MVSLYAESSAIVSWLLREAPAPRLKEILEGADLVVASELTLIECERTLTRGQVKGELSESEALERRTLLEAVSADWMFLKIGREIAERVRYRLPVEPVRTLDALHLATALSARSAISDLALLSLDQRVRDNGAALGFDVLPA